MQRLVEAATAARENAYAPYSNFAVGAAVLDEQGGLHIGCNVENAAYPLGQCAEATAIGAMIAAGGNRIEAIAVAGPDSTVCVPCGGCRQKIREFAGPDMPVFICAGGDVVEEHAFGDLLPDSFGPETMG